jgi:hypothetical protein
VPASVDAGIGRAAAVLTVPAAAVVLAVGLPAEPPQRAASDALAELVPGVGEALEPDGTYVVESVEDTIAATAPGLVAWLDEQGIDVRVRPSELAATQFGEQRVAEPGEADARLIAVSQGVVDRGWVPPEGAVDLASYDSLDPAERREAQDLLAELRASVDGADEDPTFQGRDRSSWIEAGADPEVVDRYLDLQSGRTAIRVYLVPVTGGTDGN